MAEWYYRLEGTNQGPVSEQDLKHIFESGTLSLNTPVWKEGMQDWAEAKMIPALSGSSVHKQMPSPTSVRRINQYGQKLSKPVKWLLPLLSASVLPGFVCGRLKTNNQKLEDLPKLHVINTKAWDRTKLNLRETMPQHQHDGI